MPRRILNTISLLLLTAVTVVSAARVVCLLPCLTGETSTATSHCGHETTGGTARLSAQPDDCGECDRIALEDADRLPARHALIAPSVSPSGPLVAQALPLLSLRRSASFPASPRGPSPAQAPVPLRI